MSAYYANEVLNFIIDSITTQLTQIIPTIDPNIAQSIAQTTANDLVKKFGGSNMYFPKNTKYIRHQRQKQILQEFNGSNHRELAREYGVSVQWIYHLVRNEGAKNA